jgi:hypothetical protein
MGLFSFIGGRSKDNTARFYRRLPEVGGPPPGWRLCPYVDQGGRPRHLIDASSEAEIEAPSRARFGPIYGRGPIVEFAPGRVRSDDAVVATKEEAR